MFVGSNGDTIGTSAKQNTKGGFSLFNSKGYRMCKIRIINTVFGESAIIFKV
jgi:hypothetical protein